MSIMKSTRNVLLLLLLCAGMVPLFAQQPSKDVLNFGIWQGFGGNIPTDKFPEVKGRLSNFSWKDIEPSPNQWNWAAFDRELTDKSKDNRPVIFMVYTEEDAPDWIYNNGVPKVTMKDSRGGVLGSAPYYKDDDYKKFFKRMITKVREHVETLPSSVRNNIIGIQGCYGSTGDYIGYKGEVAAQYDLTGDELFSLFKEFTTYCYNEYKNTSPRIYLLSNPLNQGQQQCEWLVQNIPESWIKCGTIGKCYQLNDEKTKATWLFDIINKPHSGGYTRARSEFAGSGSNSGWWKYKPERNLYAVFCYCIRWGLDWSNMTPEIIRDNTYDSALTFFNKYAGEKDPATGTDAICAFKDALDAADGNRFPASQFGSISRNNQQRYKSIAEKFAKYGAKLQDVERATSTELYNVDARGVNDVGWDLIPGNYERYLNQITPNETSIGRWNVDAPNEPRSMFGKFARSFDIANGKTGLYFKVDEAFLKNAPIDARYTVTITVTYLDQGNGSFKFYYDSKSGGVNKASTEVICRNTGTWKKATVKLADAYFGQRGINGSDFSIRSTGSSDVIFAMAELSRPVTAVTQSASTARNAAPPPSTNKSTENGQSKSMLQPSVNLVNDVKLWPNPVTDQLHFQSLNNEAIQTVSIYDMNGKLIYTKAVNSTLVTIPRTSFTIASGIYFAVIKTGHGLFKKKIMVQ